MKKVIGTLAAGMLLSVPVTAGSTSMTSAPAEAAQTIGIQTVMDERARASTGKAKVYAPHLESLDPDTRSNKTVVTKAGSSRVIASRNSPHPRKPFRLSPGTYKIKTTITYRRSIPVDGYPYFKWSSTKTTSRTQTVKVLKPATGTCIYMVKSGETLGKAGHRFMVWHKVGKTVHGQTGAFRSEYSDLRLKFNARNTRASGRIFWYPDGAKQAKTFNVKGKSNKSYAARGWYRVNDSAWQSKIPRKSTPHC